MNLQNFIDNKIKEYEHLSGGSRQESKWLKEAFKECSQATLDSVRGEKIAGESVMQEKGSEFTTPRMYRAYGHNSAISDSKAKEKLWMGSNDKKI